ncbi:MAG: lamin tail domain-containing protein, partial [Tepidisphaeraceae bacterium]
WYPQIHAGGFSLTVRSPLQALSLWNSSAGWRASAAPNGSPGTGDTLPTPGSVVINEVLASAASQQNDGIELANTTGQAIDISGWFLSDASTNLAMYQLPANTIIAANGYMVFMDGTNYDNASDPGCHVPFALSALGGDVYLTSNYAGVPGGYQEHVSLGASPPGISSGLVVKSTGGTDFTLLQTPTLGAANSIAYISPIVINELMYHPPAPTAAEIAAGYTDNDMFEFLELYNRSSTTQTLSNFYVGDGVGFTFGWYADSSGTEEETLEPGATATWTASGFTSGSHTLYAHINLVDGNGNRRANLDSVAQYSITYMVGSSPVTTTVTVDQNQTTVSGNDTWVNLGSYTFSGSVTVQLTRNLAAVSQWTVADSLKVSTPSQSDVVVNAPTFDSVSMDRGITTLAPGAYVVLVSDLAAFDYRYHITANNIPVAGVYTGHLNNGGEWVRLYQIGNLVGAYLPDYEVDRVNYNNNAPWPPEPDGNGPALIRVHPSAYANDPANWLASNVLGTPGQANIPLDNSAPTTPTNLTAHTTLTPASLISLTWSASSDPQSYVDHYNIYRNGTLLASTAGTSYFDSTALTAVSYSYQVSAVNRDGYESNLSPALVIMYPAAISTVAIDSTHIAVVFSEPLNPSTALTLGRYVFSGGTLTAAALSLNNTRVILTTKSAMTLNSAYTLTISGLTTASSNQLPASIPLMFTYTGSNVDLTPPSTPANLRATTVSATQIVLAWDASIDPESGVDHYIIYRDG